jgi:hypothetical protein
VPLYVSRFLFEFHNDEEQYSDDLECSVKDSLFLLKRNNEEGTWKAICESVFSSLLESTTSATSYDKNFFVQLKAGPMQYQYLSIVPLVLGACRSHLWPELMAHVAEKEERLVRVCADPCTLNDSRGRHFELIVVRRCVQHGVRVQLSNEEVAISASLGRHNFTFPGQHLPRFMLGIDPDGVYVQIDPNFPAIDLVWKLKDVIIGVQVHVTRHKDVFDTFSGLCKEAGWLDDFQSVYLIYLSPEDEVTNLMDNIVNPPTRSVRKTRSNASSTIRNVTLRAISKDSVQCLVDLQWPQGSSLPG